MFPIGKSERAARSELYRNVATHISLTKSFAALDVEISGMKVSDESLTVLRACSAFGISPEAAIKLST